MQAQIRNFGWNRSSLIGLIVYLGVGGLTFIVDASLIYASIHLLHAHYPTAVAIGFIFGAFFNYVVNRKLVYANSTQSHTTALIWFFGIAFVWLWFTVGGTVFLVQKVHIPLYVSRSLVGIFVAVAGFVLNSIFTFKMDGKMKVPVKK